MSASSFSVAAAAIGTGSNCFFSSTSIDYHLSLSIFPFKTKPIKKPSKLKNYLDYSLFSPISCSSIHCASTAFDSVELNEDEVEEDPESGAEETVSEVEEEDNDVSQSADGGRSYRRRKNGGLRWM
ncbi:hypothetical protein CASFOL_013540 [Castilleja foliolosa]|uniref:Uncharacterized protein n=1 Tax=Castilleja foliolosa TaxID=1961234 RepID=A0ABD3DKB2_9LAMI